MVREELAGDKNDDREQHSKKKRKGRGGGRSPPRTPHYFLDGGAFGSYVSSPTQSLMEDHTKICSLARPLYEMVIDSKKQVIQ